MTENRYLERRLFAEWEARVKGNTWVFLSVQEMVSACDCGTRRWIHARHKKLNYVLPRENERLGNMVLQAIAECAVAKYLGTYWCGEWGSPNAPDLLGVLNVRFINPNLAILPISNDDDPEQYFCLTTGWPPNILLCGVIQGAAAKTDENLVFVPGNEHRGAFWRVSAEQLTPFDTWHTNWLKGRKEP